MGKTWSPSSPFVLSRGGSGPGLFLQGTAFWQCENRVPQSPADYSRGRLKVALLQRPQHQALTPMSDDSSLAVLVCHPGPQGTGFRGLLALRS